MMKPRWQHADAEVRRRAIEELPPGEREIVEQVVRDDEAPAVRRLGIRRCVDLSLIAERALDDPDASVREQAAKRYRQLVAGLVEDSPPLDQRLAIVEATSDQALLEHVVREGNETALRQRALGKVTRLPVLRDVSLGDTEVSLRLSALERIEDESTLERVYQRSRKTDKRVSRRAKEKLDALAAERERPLRAEAECKQICAAADRLGRDGSWERDRAQLDDLDRRWGAIEADLRGAAYTERFEAARSAFLALYQAHQQSEPPIRAAKEAAIAALEALLEPSNGPDGQQAGEEPLAEAGGAPAPGSRAGEKRTDKALVESLTAAARAARVEWRNGPTLAAPEEEALSARFDAALAAVEERARTLRTELDLGAVRVASDKLLRRKGVIAERDVKELERQREAAGAATGSRAVEKLARRIDRTHAALRERLREQLKRKDEALETLPDRIDALKQAVADGNAAEAVPLHDDIERDLESVIAMGTSRQRVDPLRSRFKALSPEVGVMRAWDRYGAKQARERLVETMEALVGSDDHPEEIARRIRDARAEWKRLSERDRDVKQSLWRRFDAAARKAHEPCAAYFEQQAGERKANLERRRALADKLEAFLADADWAAMDWKAAVKLRRDLSNEWHQARAVDRKAGRALDKRWSAGLKAMDQHLGEERDRCARARESLIDQAAALAEHGDARKAVDECKALQRQWQTTVPGSRGRENDLWRRFRAACDAVFAERQKAFDERRARSQADIDQRKALCERAERLADADPASIEESARELKRIQGEWRELGALPKRDGAAVDKRFSRAVRAFREVRESLARAAEREDLARLERKAALCHEVETGSDTPALEALRERLDAMGPQADTAQDAALVERLERACAGSDAASAVANQETRENLCLRMEILAGVDSPPEHASARMAYQVQRLASALSAREGGGSDSLESLVEAWCLTGPAPAEQAGALESRFGVARDALRAQAAADG